MTAYKFFKKGEKLKPQEVIAKLKHSEASTGRENAMLLLHDANTMGFGVDALLHQNVEGGNGLNGFEATFAALGVPLNLKDDTAIAAFASATTSFMTNDGLSVLLPSLVNNLLRSQVSSKRLTI